MRWSSSTLGVLFAAAVSSTVIHSQSPQAVFRKVLLDSRADIATDGIYVYAVDSADHAIVRTLVNGPRTWERLPIPAVFGQISGLAAIPGKLFVIDSKASKLATITTTSSLPFGVTFLELPLKRPESVAAAGGQIFVTDSADGVIARFQDGVFQGNVFGSSLQPRQGLRLYLSGSGDTLVAGRTDGTLLMTESVQLVDKVPPKFIQRPPGSTNANPLQLRGAQYQRISGEEETRAVRPIAVSVYRGLLYLVDATESGVFVIEPLTGRPLHINDPDDPILGAARIATTERTLFVLTFDGVLREFERPVPAEIIAERAAIPVLIPLLYQTLREQHLLATRRVQIAGGLEATLRRTKLLGGSVLGSDVRALVCNLNPSVCATPLPLSVPDGEWLTVPDWDTSNYVSQQRVTLADGRSLQDELDRHIVSPEFAAWKKFEKVQELNGVALPATTKSLNEVRKGSFFVPTELIRFLIPVPQSDTIGATGLFATLRKGIEGIRIRSLEPFKASAAAPVPAQEPPPIDWMPLALAHDRMRATIKAAGLPLAIRPDSVVHAVGIAEVSRDSGLIDQGSPDFAPETFVDDGILTTSLAPGGAAAAGASAATPQPSAGTPGLAPWREFTTLDHGTAVASIIGATKFQFGKTGLAAGVPLRGLWRDEPEIDGEVEDAFLQSGVRIFNFSFAFPKNTPQSLGKVIDNYPLALFVVAAGNSWVTSEDDGKICEGSLQIFPACYAAKPNVLVVTATDVDGTHIISAAKNGQTTDPGVNWHPDLVHLAAPGEGFYASGYKGGYVPVRGSSFAAPLVTAVAVALHAQGVTDPVLIKQRLIATADVIPTLTKYVFGGRLNAERALAWTRRGVVTEAGVARPISILKSDKVTIPVGAGSEIVPMANIRRILRVGNKVHVVYAVTSKPSSPQLGVVPDVLRVLDVRPGDWKLNYRDVNPQTGQDVGPQKQLNLGQVEDYVGPIQ